jgi:hypothetical protein
MFKIPLAHHTKQPIGGKSWYKTMTDDPGAHIEWIGEGLNVGVPLEANGLVVVDYDTGMEPARGFFKKHRELCSVIVQTRRGVHFYFTGSTKTRKFDHGDIKGSGYVVAPPSVFQDSGILHPYLYVKGYEWKLPKPFPDHLFEDTRKEVKRTLTRDKVKDLRSYLAKIESIQGANGSAGLVRAAAVCRDAGVPEAEAMMYLMGWNLGPTVSPKWTPIELARAITNTYKVKQ